MTLSRSTRGLTNGALKTMSCSVLDLWLVHALEVFDPLDPPPPRLAQLCLARLVHWLYGALKTMSRSVLDSWIVNALEVLTRGLSPRGASTNTRKVHETIFLRAGIFFLVTHTFQGFFPQFVAQPPFFRKNSFLVSKYWEPHVTVSHCDKRKFLRCSEPPWRR